MDVNDKCPPNPFKFELRNPIDGQEAFIRANLEQEVKEEEKQDESAETD